MGLMDFAKGKLGLRDELKMGDESNIIKDMVDAMKGNKDKWIMDIFYLPWYL